MDNPSRPIAILSAIINLGLGIAWGFAESGIFTVIPAEIYEPILTVFTPITVLIGVFALSVNKSGDAKQELSNRKILINTVQRNWIEGVLHDALRDAEFQLDIEGKPEKAGESKHHSDYKLPIDLVLWNENIKDSISYTPDVLLQTFNDVDKKLLILGAPGSGKTVLMLQLTEKLLEDARKGKPIPLVFNLSSWAEKRKSLTDWLIEQMQRDYGAGNKIAKELIQSDSLIYLLDGFDEVAEAHREECLTKINEFMSPTRQVVICSRIEEYETLAQPLNTKFAIELQTLSDEQFRDELSKRLPKSETTEAILKTLQADNNVWEEVKKPLFINILINTYADGKPFPEHNIEGTTIEKLQLLVIEPYITRQLQNNSSANYDNEFIRRCLSWVSHNLKREKQKQFFVEMLQQDWLINKKQKRIQFSYKITIALMIGQFIGLGYSILHQLMFKSSALIGLFISILFYSFLPNEKLDLQKSLRFNLAKLLMGLREGSKALIRDIWRLFVLILFFTVFSVESGDWFASLTQSVIATVVAFVLIVLFLGIFVGISHQSSISTRTKYNEGLRETVILGTTIGLIAGLTTNFLTIDGGFSIFMSIVAGLIGGLGDSYNHIFLRIILYQNNLAPKRFDTFLEHVIERRIMRRVGGSAIFIHRYILEYFADEWQRKYAKEFEE